jgi:hypothetical protein
MPVCYIGIVQGWLLSNPYTLRALKDLLMFHLCYNDLRSYDSIIWQYKFSHIHFTCRVHPTSSWRANGQSVSIATYLHLEVLSARTSASTSWGYVALVAWTTSRFTQAGLLHEVTPFLSSYWLLRWSTISPKFITDIRRSPPVDLTMSHLHKGPPGSVVGWGTMLQAGRSQVRVPMRWIF